MRVLVTGSSGFIGSHIVQALLEADHEVVGLDARPSIVSGSPFRELVGDVCNPEILASALEGVNVVCHQAAKVGLGVDIDDMPDYVLNNDLATAKLLAAMGRVGTSAFVLASSMVVYGEGAYSCEQHGQVLAPPRAHSDLASGRFEPRCSHCDANLQPNLVDEGAALDPRNAYAASKVAQEHLVSSWARQLGGRAIALRYHNVYGPRMPKNTPYAGVASIFRSAIAKGRAPQVFEDGGQRRDFVHVRDVAHANVMAIEALMSEWTTPGPIRPYNVASGHVRTVLDLAIALSESLNGPAPVVTGEFRLGDVRHIAAAADAITVDLGWQAGIDFADGMAELAGSADVTSS